MRAKLKSWNEIPEKYKCCESTITQMRKFQTVIFELISGPFEKTTICPYCNATWTGMRFKSRCNIYSGVTVEVPVDGIAIEEGS